MSSSQLRRRGNKRDRALIQLGIARATTLVLEEPQFVFRPNEPNPNRNVFATWPTTFAAASSVAGPRTIEIDGRLNGNQATIPDGAWNFGPTADVTMIGTGFLDPNTDLRTRLNVGNATFTDGAGGTCLASIRDLFVNFTGNAPAVQLSANGNTATEFLLQAANVQSSAAAPFFGSGGGGGVLYLMEGATLLTGAGPSLKSAGTAFTDLTIGDAAQLAAGALAADATATMLLVIVGGSGVVSLTQPACLGASLVVSRASPTENITLQKGTALLASGVSAAIPATITAASRIVATRKDPSTSTAIGILAALTVDRVVGAPGSFKVTSQRTTAATETNDVSTVDWHVVG